MDNPNITMEEYISLEEEKAHQHGKVYNWETAKYGKIWYDEDVHDLRSVETEFPTIVSNDELSSEKTLSCKPMVSSLNNNEIDFRISFDESDDEDYTVVFDKNLFSYKLIYVNDLKTDSENDNKKVNMPSFRSPKPKRHEMIFERQVNRVHLLDFEGLTPDMRQDLAVRLRMVYTRDDGQEVFVSHAWRRLFEIRAPLVHEFLLDFFSTCRIGSEMSDDGLRGLSVVTRELSLIDMGELIKLTICMEVGDNWAWVALEEKRQPVAVSAAPGDVEDAPDINKGRTIPQRLGRLEEEIQGLRQDVRSLQGLMKRPMTDQGRFSTWMVSCMMQLMKASRRTYQAFDGIFRGSYPEVFEMLSRRRT
ncbi:hypothetical protein Tco_0467941 [Tanacetum coccineum]